MASRLVRVAQSEASPLAQTISVGGHAILADEPAILGGADAGPSPFELVLAGLGACTAMTLRLYAKHHDWPLTGVAVGLRHSEAISADGKSKIDQYTLDVTLAGALTGEQRQQLLAIADRCPVGRMLGRASEVKARLVEEESEMARLPAG